MDLIQTISVGNTLGEGVLWDVESQSLWWTDIQRRALFTCDWRSQRLTRFATPERLGSFGLVAGSDKIVAAFESGFAFFHPANGGIEWLERPLHGMKGVRFNDGRVDRQGRFWAGTMAETKSQVGNANLYCLNGSGQAHPRESGIAISNGICWSPDSSRFYFADSPKGTISVYDFDSAMGAILELPPVRAQRARRIAGRRECRSRRLPLERAMGRRLHNTIRAGRTYRSRARRAGQPGDLRGVRGPCPRPVVRHLGAGRTASGGARERT